MNPVPDQTKSAIPLEQFLALSDFESAAKQVLPHAVYEYVASGAGNEFTLGDNERAYDRIRIWPRVLRDVRTIDTRVSLFGKELRSPVLLAPAAYQKTMHPLGETGTTLGAGKAGVPFVVSTNTTVAIEELAGVASAPLWFQLYVQHDRSVTLDLIQRVEAAGCEAICVTVDTPVLGVRTRQLRAGFQLAPGIVTPHNRSGSGVEGEWIRVCIARCSGTMIAWLRSVVKAKLWLKGILHPADADEAIQMGVDGIMVSNHGARNWTRCPRRFQHYLVSAAESPEESPSSWTVVFAGEQMCSKRWRAALPLL